MFAQKKMLSFEELEAQTMVALPDRELMHVRKHGSHGSHAGASSTTTTTTTSFACGNQDNSHSADALLQVGTLFLPINAPILSCNTVTF
jgi:hypothetical protein